MIGLFARPASHSIAREFLELCKTPWEVAREDASYPVALVLGDEAAGPLSSLVLRYVGARTQPPASGTNLLFEGRDLPLHAGGTTSFPESKARFLTSADDGRSIVKILRHAPDRREVLVGYDLVAEVRHLLTCGQLAADASSPSLELHIRLLRELIVRNGKPFVEIPPVPHGYLHIACLTHDIDHPILRNHRFDHTMFGFLGRATAGSLAQRLRGRISTRRMLVNWRAAARLPFVHLGLVEDFWRPFDRFLEIESGRPSTFFTIPEAGNPGRRRDGSSQPKRAASYNLEEVAPVLNRIADAGCEISLHGLDAWRDVGAGRSERARVTKAVPSAGDGVRMHWLYFDQDSPAALDDAGFAYDSTFGYNETIGFRAGTAQVFRPPGTERLLELPLIAMDTALFYPSYLDLSEEEAFARIGRILDDLATFGGAFTVNWHDRSIAPERQWDEFYRRLLDELTRRNAWFATAAGAVAWFDQRRSVRLSAEPANDHGLRIEARVDGRDPALPGMILRIHNALGMPPAEDLAAGPVSHQDFPLSETMGIHIAL